MDTFITMDLLPINRPNKNNRIYSPSCVDKIVSDFHTRKETNGFVFGELDPPSSNTEALKIHLDRISHQVEDIFIEGNFLKAKIKISPTPMGNILKELHSAGVSIGLAMRGFGEVHDSGHINNYNFITVDITVNPNTITEKDKCI